MAYKNILPQSYAQFLGLATNANYTPNYTWTPLYNDISGSTLNNRSRLGAWFYIKVFGDVGGNQIDGREMGMAGKYSNTCNFILKAIVKTDSLNIQTKDRDYEDQIVEGAIQEDVLTAFSRVYDELCTADVTGIEYQGESEVVDEVDHGERVVRKDYIFTVTYRQNRFIK